MIIFFSNNHIFRQTHPVQPQPLTGQQNTTYIFDLSGQLTSHEDLTADAIAFLQQQLAHWCTQRNIHGSLTPYLLGNVELTDGDLSELLYEKNILNPPPPPPPDRLEDSCVTCIVFLIFSLFLSLCTLVLLQLFCLFFFPHFSVRVLFIVVFCC